MVGQLGCVSSKPACPRPLSNWRLVEAGGSAFSKAAKGHHGLWRCYGISAIPRSHRGAPGRTSRGTMRGSADSGDHRVAAGLAHFRTGLAGGGFTCEESKVAYRITSKWLL